MVLTGGPCSGKTKALGYIRKRYESLGYTVIVIPETATEFLVNGFRMDMFPDLSDIQSRIMRLQAAKEDSFVAALDGVGPGMCSDRVLMVCDRGVLDSEAYLTAEQFDRILSSAGIDRESILDRYDAVFHLLSVAKTLPEKYSSRSNEARRETVQEAAAVDDRLISAWSAHPCFRVIGENGITFDGKLQLLFTEIDAVLGITSGVEIERKFLIEYPDRGFLGRCSVKKNIVQTYLIPERPGTEVRVRRTETDGNVKFRLTEKSSGGGIKRTEKETEITRQEYERLLEKADPERRPVEKTRYCLYSGGFCYETDVYPFWTGYAVMEVELKSEEIRVPVPEGITVVRDVTDDAAFRNSSMAAKIPELP